MEKNRDDERHRRALKRILDHYSITPAELAQRAGISADILYNLLNGQSQSLSSITTEQIILKFEDLTDQHFRDPDLPIPAPISSNASGSTVLKGGVHCGKYSDSADYPPSEQKRICYPGKAPAGLYALEVINANGLYEAGDILFCVPLASCPQGLPLNGYVITHRYTLEGVEVAVWDYRQINHMKLLFNRGRLRLPDDYQGGPFEFRGGRMEVVAVVIGNYRNPQQDVA